MVLDEPRGHVLGTTRGDFLRPHRGRGGGQPLPEHTNDLWRLGIGTTLIAPPIEAMENLLRARPQRTKVPVKLISSGIYALGHVTAGGPPTEFDRGVVVTMGTSVS